jgi:hypothetical protein
MARYAVETRSTEPKNFFAGDFPTLPETGTAGEKLAEHTPVTVNEAGEIVAVAAATTGDVVGVTAEAAEKGEPVVYYMTGEFFADALNLPEGVAIEDIKDSLRKLSIFLR